MHIVQDPQSSYLLYISAAMWGGGEGFFPLHTQSRVKKKAYVKGYRFQTVSLVWDRVLQKGSLKKCILQFQLKIKMNLLKFITYTTLK